MVGGPGRTTGVREGGAGQAVSAELPPEVDAVPDIELVAHCTGYLGPTQVHCGGAGLRGESGGRERRRRGRLLRRGQLCEKQEDGGNQEGYRQPASWAEQARQTVSSVRHGAPSPYWCLAHQWNDEIMSAQLLTLTSLLARVYQETFCTFCMTMIILSHYILVKVRDLGGASQEGGE